MKIPAQYVESVLDIDPAWIVAQGKDTVLVDLDNTLLPRDTSQFSPEILAWCQSLYDAGLKVCLISNNWHERVHTAAKELDMELVSKAVKPLPFAFWLSIKRAHSKSGETRGRRKNTIMIGDQLFTDVLGSALLGIPCVMVLPLAKKDLTHTLLLRHVEKLIMRDRQPAPIK
ncbi:MAG: YqeG family HAD IIIA-type phosphatase [Coriobacteriia bacterium]|nr:YqeG family HAD IIIA-type phosphatase [Coriobacteriia bacterium]MCL2536693.1 YqeG family HAD IIIA-type phosphatase [Coriobacteriia bacterium]